MEDLSLQTLIKIIGLNHSKDKASVPVMINYVPVVLLAPRPMFYCIQSNEHSTVFGYTYYRSMRNLVVESTSISTLHDLIYKHTIVEDIGLEDEEIPEELKPFTKNRNLTDIEFISQRNGFGVKAINFITSDYAPFIQCCRNFSRIYSGPTTTADKFIKYALMCQTKMDAYAYFNAYIGTFLSKYIKLDNTVVSSININGSSFLREIVRSLSIDFSRIDAREIESPDYPNYSIQIAVHAAQEEISVSRVDPTSVDPAILMSADLQYNVVGLAVLAEDFGEGKISGITQWRQINNPFFEILMVNYKLYGFLIKNLDNLIYRQAFTRTPLIGDLFTYTQDSNSEVSFRSLLGDLV